MYLLKDQHRKGSVLQIHNCNEGHYIVTFLRCNKVCAIGLLREPNAYEPPVVRGIPALHGGIG